MKKPAKKRLNECGRYAKTIWNEACDEWQAFLPAWKEIAYIISDTIGGADYNNSGKGLKHEELEEIAHAISKRLGKEGE